MKIRKYNAGGIYYTPFIPNNAYENVQGNISTATSNNTLSNDDTFTKEALEIISENGIPTDVDTFLRQANAVLDKSKNFSANLFGAANQSYNVSDIIKLRSLANRTKFNKQLYDAATEQLSKERSWAEAAVDDKGRMYVYSENDGISTVDPSEYYSNKDKYQALTNSQLLSLREHQPELAYRQDILNNLSNSVGMESIVNYLKGVIKDFGTKTIEGYTLKNKEQIEDGFRSLLMGGPDGYYKITNKDQGTERALEYLYTTLPSNMLHALRVKTAAEGGNPNSKTEVLNLLGLALAEHTTHSRELAFQKEMTDSLSSGSGSSKKPDETELSQLEALANGRIVKGRQMLLSPSDSKIAISAYAQSYGAPVDKNGNIVPQTNLQQLLDKADFGKIVDKSSIYFGDQKVRDIDINKILWDGTSQVNRVILPFTIERDGSFKPDFESHARFEEFQKFLDDFPDITSIQKLEKAKTLGLDVIYDEKTGRYIYNPDSVMSFIVMTGYSSSKTMLLDEDSRWLYHLTRPEGREVTDYYDTQINYGEGFSTKSKKPANEAKSSRGTMYKSTIFMPIPDERLAIYQSNNELVPTSNYRDIYNQAIAKHNQNAIKTNF